MVLYRALLSDTWRARVEAVRAAKDEAEQKRLKKALPCFTPSGTFSHVSRNGLLQHSGFISLDIDYNPKAGINKALAGFDLKKAVEALPFVAYCGRSCRGAGYVLIIPIADTAKHLEYFRALSYYFERAGLEIDAQCKDVSRKRFVSWDENPYINTAARPWEKVLPEREHTTRETIGRELDESENAAKVEAVIGYCEREQLDITANYSDWVKILSAFTIFGDAGRDYAHRISKFYPGYSQAQTDAKYSNLLRHPEYKTGLGTFFYIARQEIGKHDFDGLDL